MPDISVQFYATPEELASLLKLAAVEFGVHLVAVRSRPFNAVGVDADEIDTYVKTLPAYRRWALSVEPPLLSVQHELDFQNKNSDHLRLDIGNLDTSSLEQSWISCRTESKLALAVWRKIAKLVKEMTLAGITAKNRQNGLLAEYKNFRYTKGAKALEDGGIVMLPAAGVNGPEIKLGLLPSKKSSQ